MDLGLRGRVCVVTGASGGIGSATAKLLANEGAELILIGRRTEALEQLRPACTEAGAKQVHTVTADLAEPQAADEILAATDRLDVLINSAGITGTRPLDELPDQAWQEQWDLHVMASMRLMRAAAPRMAANRWGRIVNVTSSSAKRPSGNLDMAYSVTKAAQLSLSRAFADRFAASGVTVNAVAPGAIDGDMWRTGGGLADQLAARSGRSPEEVMEQMASRTPRGRLGTEDEVAAVIVFLCSEQAANVSGAAWAVDGGSVPTIF